MDRYLQALPCKSSCGPDNIPAIFLERLHSALALPLCLLFQHSLNSNTLPSVWKEANVIPIYKKMVVSFVQKIIDQSAELRMCTRYWNLLSLTSL